MKAHILILNFNGAQLLDKYLGSFVESLSRSKHECRVSVIDNASRDNSREIVEKWNGRVGWIPMKENRVLCAYNEVVDRLDDDVVVLMNNDIEVGPGFLDPLIEPFNRDPDVFFVTPKCLGKDKKTYEGNRTLGQMRFGVFWSSSVYPGHERDMDRSCLTLQGGFGAFHRGKFLELAGYDDLYLPGRLEDADICFRAYKKGWKCLYEPSSVVYHQGGVSFNKEFGIRGTLVINWRNTFLFMWKNLDGSALAQFLFWLPVRLLHSLLFMKPELFLGFFRAVPMCGKAIQRRRLLKASGLLSAIPDHAIFRRVTSGV